MKYVFLAVFSVCAVYAQVDAGGISGVVTDGSGAVVPGVRIQITQENTNVSTEFATNASGFYAAPALRPGAYRITVTKEGFRAEKRTGIELRVQDRLEVNFQLEVGTASTEVMVSASAPLLESETSSLGQVVEEKTITDLPLNGRNFIQLATLGAGTLPSTRTAERDSFISNGARGVQNSYLLDGIDNRNRILGFDKNSAQIIQPDYRRDSGVQGSDVHVLRGVRPGGRRSGQRDHEIGHQQPPRQSVRVPAEFADGRDAVFSAVGQTAVHPESVRRHTRRPHHKEPNLRFR